MRFLTVGQTRTDGVALLNHVVVVTAVKRAVEEMRVRRKISNELAGVLAPGPGVAVAVAVGVLEHEKVDVVARPLASEIKGPVQRWEGELRHDLHGSVERCGIGPGDGLLNHSAPRRVNGPAAWGVWTNINVGKHTVAVDVCAPHIVDHQSDRRTSASVVEVVDAVLVRVSLDRCATDVIDARRVQRCLRALIEWIAGGVDIVYAVVVVVVVLCSIGAAVVVPIAFLI